MTSGAVRRRVLLAALLTVLAIVTVASAGSGHLTRPASFVPDRSTPSSTVRAFVAAVQGEATEVAWAMVTPQARSRGLLDAEIEDPPTVSDVAVVAPSVGVAPILEPGYAQVVEVRVTFFVQDWSGGAGFGHGPAWWGYRVVRNGPTDPWSIASSGV